MPRIRTIKPEWIDDERFNACSDAAIRLAKVLYALVDDDGRCKKSVRALGLDGWKYCDSVTDKTAHAQAAVNELVKCRWLISYVVGGEQHWCIRNFAVHQRIAHYVASKLPSPPEDLVSPREAAREAPETSGDLANPPETSSLIGSGSGSEGIGKERSGSERASALSPISDSKPEHVVRFANSHGATSLPLDERIHLHDLEALFSKLRDAAGHGTWKRGSRGYDALCAQVTWANDPEQGSTREERLRACQEAFLGHLMCQRDFIVKAKWSPIFLDDMGAARAVYLESLNSASPRGEADRIESQLSSVEFEISELDGEWGAADKLQALHAKREELRAALRAARGVAA